MLRDKLVELRKAKGLTQDDLSKLTGISRVIISRYENDTYPTKKNLLKLQEALGLPDNFFSEYAIKEQIINGRIDVTTLKRKLDAVYKFSPEDQNILVNMIDIITERKDLLKKIQNLKDNL